MIKRYLSFVSVAFALAAALATQAAWAQSSAWPQRPVKFVLPLGPGAGADIGARLLADRLSRKWGQSVVVENRPGADNVIAINAVINARDDHVLMFGPSSGFVGHPYMLDRQPYNPKDLVPIARVSVTLVAAAVPPSLGVSTAKQLFDKARAEPGKLNWATVTGMTDILVAGFLKTAGLDMQKVPYRDTVQALNDLTEGRIHFYIAAYAIVRAQAQAGRVKLIAVTNRARAPMAPDVPTMAEAGFPQLSFDGLAGVFGPPNVAPELREKIAADVKAALDDDFVKRLEATGQLVVPGDAAQFSAAIQEQQSKLAETAAALGMKPKW
jgi:tripartite-type tricarboxylate transporter receptor subunit TctC